MATFYIMDESRKRWLDQSICKIFNESHLDGNVELSDYALYLQVKEKLVRENSDFQPFTPHEVRISRILQKIPPAIQRTGKPSQSHAILYVPPLCENGYKYHQRRKVNVDMCPKALPQIFSAIQNPLRSLSAYKTGK